MSISFLSANSRGYTALGDFGLTLRDPYTLMAWIYVENTTIDQTFLSLGDGDSSSSPNGDLYYLMQKSSSSVIAVRMMPWGLGKFLVAKTTANNPINRATWHHITFTRDSSNIYRVYIDGIYNTGANFTSSMTSRPADPIGRLDIGPGITGFASGFVGKIAHVKMWSRAMSTTEIKSEAEYAAPISRNGLVAWYPFRSSSDPGLDASGNGRDAVVNGYGSVNPVYDSDMPPIDTYRPVVVYGQVGFNRDVRRGSVRELVAFLSFSGDSRRAVTKAVGGMVSFTGSLVRRMIVRLIAILSFSQSLRTKYDLTMAISAVVSFAGKSRFTLNRKIGGSVSFKGATSQIVRRLLALVGGLSFSGSAAKRLTHRVAGNLSFSGTIRRNTLVNLAGSLTPEAVLQFGHRVVMVADVYFNSHVTRSMLRSVSGTLGFVGSVRSSTIRFVKLAGALDLSGVVRRRGIKRVEGAVTFSGVIVRNGRKILEGVLDFSRSFGMVRKGLVVISATLSFAGLVSRSMTRSFKGSLSFGGSVSRDWFLALGGAVTFDRLLNKNHIKNLAGNLGFTGRMGRSFVVKIYGTVRFSAGVMAEKAGEKIRATATLIGRKFSSIRLRGELDE